MQPLRQQDLLVRAALSLCSCSIPLCNAPRGTLIIHVALIKQNYTAVHWLNSRVFIISTRCVRNTTEVNGYFFLNKNTRVWLTPILKSNMFETRRLRWRVNSHILIAGVYKSYMEKRCPISILNVTKKKQRGKWKYYAAINLLYSFGVSSAWQPELFLRILVETCREWTGSAGTLAKLEFSHWTQGGLRYPLKTQNLPNMFVYVDSPAQI